MTIIIFIIVLSILVFVHELGHFFVAKKSAMKVEEFGFGFPPRIFGIKRGQTIYSINWIPFGGFVKILGENGEEKEDPSSFSSKPLSVRAFVIVAGVVMNFLFAVALLSIVTTVGLRIGISDNETSDTVITDKKVQIIQVNQGSPAEKAGLSILDEIISIKSGTDVVVVTSVESVQNFIDQHKEQPVTFAIGKGDSQNEVTLTPRTNPPPGEGAVGIAMTATGLIRYPWYLSFTKGFQYAGVLFANTLIGYFTVIKNVITSGAPGVELSGPIGIANITGQAAHFGFIYLLQFMALISINLAVLNIIPFPALDGGRLLFIFIEKIKGKPLSKKFEMITNSVGFLLLIMLMIYVTTKDISRLF